MFLARSLFLVVAATQLCFAETQAHASTPARFVEGEESLENLVAFPDVPGNLTLNVYCRAVIGPKGQMKQNFCFRSEKVDQAFRDAIDTAAKSAKLLPAIVSGEPHRVIFWYRVMFVRVDGKSMIRVFPNWARDIDKYGNDYEGPQRVSRLMLPRACSTRGLVTMDAADSLRSKFENPSVFLIATLTIDASGEPLDDVVFESTSNVEDSRCRSRIREELERADYIPGYRNGEPVEATFVQPVGSYEDMEFR